MSYLEEGISFLLSKVLTSSFRSDNQDVRRKCSASLSLCIESFQMGLGVGVASTFRCKTIEIGINLIRRLKEDNFNWVLQFNFHCISFVCSLGKCIFMYIMCNLEFFLGEEYEKKLKKIWIFISFLQTFIPLLELLLYFYVPLYQNVKTKMSISGKYFHFVEVKRVWGWAQAVVLVVAGPGSRNERCQFGCCSVVERKKDVGQAVDIFWEHTRN